MESQWYAVLGVAAKEIGKSVLRMVMVMTMQPRDTWSPEGDSSSNETSTATP